MAPAAFIFDDTFHMRISIHLRTDFGLPQGVFGGIGHHGGSPLRIVGYIVAGLVRQAAVTPGTDAGARKIIRRKGRQGRLSHPSAGTGSGTGSELLCKQKVWNLEKCCNGKRQYQVPEIPYPHLGLLAEFQKEFRVKRFF
jgi:hypothetical protein